MRLADWVDRTEYPFESKWFDWDHKTMHYVDVGRGSPVVFVHGTPTWSFMYRGLIKGLSGEFRCIAMDNVGFGLSDKPAAFIYRPEKQADYLEALINDLKLKDLTLVVHDFGGPIGLSYAIKHPENVKHIVLMNTWMWSLKNDQRAMALVRRIQGPTGRWLYLKTNFVTKVVLPTMIKDKEHFNRVAGRHYVKPFESADSRFGPYGYAKALIGSSDWFQQLWFQRDALKPIPAMILWGTLDPFFTNDALERWRGVWPEAEVRRLPHTGHFVPEERGADLLPPINTFLEDTSFLPTSTVDV